MSSAIRDAIANAIKSHSSPTIGRGDIHGGQAGYIIYERDGLPGVIAAIERAIGECAPTREGIAELIEFVRGALNDCSFSGYDPSPARAALAIAKRLPALVAEIERLRDGVNSIVNCQSMLPRQAVRDACAEILNGKISAMEDQSPFIVSLREARADLARLTKERDDARAIIDGQNRIIRKTRDIVSKCAAAGFVYDKAPIDELYANQAALTSAIARHDAPAPAEADIARLSRENAAMREALEGAGRQIADGNTGIATRTIYAALKDQQERGIFPVRVAGEWEAIGAAEKQQRDALKQAFESAQHNRAAIAQLDAPPAEEAKPYQARVHDWILACFGAEIGADKIERNHRLLEEALEAVQAGGCTRSEAHQLVDYVFDRSVGDLWQEVGGVMNTLAAFCTAHGLDMAECGERELARVWTKVEAIRAKQAAKPKHSPLPMVTPERLPEPSALAAARETIAEAVERLRKFAGLKPVSGSLRADHYFIETDAISAARAFIEAHGKASEP